MENDTEKVERSRLKLLAVLTAAGASGACMPEPQTWRRSVAPPPNSPSRRSNRLPEGFESEGNGEGESNY